MPGEIVGGIVEISATINDNAGVLDSSVIAIIGDETGTPLFELPLKPRGAGMLLRPVRQRPPHAVRRSRRRPPLCIVFPTVSFRASDQVGNETVVGYDFAVDNIAPLADLDPPEPARHASSTRVLRCSHEFDPLGNDDFYGDMPNDGKMVPQVFDLRARIEDDGNRAAGLKLSPISLVDPHETSVLHPDDSRRSR